jgi:hypothetical protein
MFKANSLQRIHLSKITEARWTRSVVQAVQCLLCKHKVLRSNPSPTKKTNKKTKTCD